MAREPLRPNTALLGAIRGRARWKAGDLNALRVVQETARVSAIRTQRLSATWSRRTAGNGERGARGGVVSAHTVAGRGGRERGVREMGRTTLRAAFTAGDDREGESGGDETVMESLEIPAARHAAASGDITDAWDERSSEEESCGTEIEAEPRLADDIHGPRVEHAWDAFALFPPDDAVSPIAPQLEDFSACRPLSAELDLRRFCYLPVVQEMDPRDDQDAVLQWIMDDIEDVDGADL